MDPKRSEEKHVQQRTNRRSYYCVARWCNNHNSNSSAMFRLPKGPRGKQWLRNAEREDLLDLEETKLHRKYMCSRHFTPECFLKSNMLTWNAVPTLFTTFSKLAVSGKPVRDMKIPLAPKYFLIKENDCIDMKNSSFISPTRSQNVILTSSNVMRNEYVGKKSCNREVKSSLRTVTSHVNCNSSTQKPVIQASIEVCPEGTEVSESDHMVFPEEFSLMKQEPVLSCGTCGEIFLVESGLTQHRLRYHSDAGVKDVH